MEHHTLDGPLRLHKLLCHHHPTPEASHSETLTSLLPMDLRSYLDRFPQIQRDTSAMDAQAPEKGSKGRFSLTASLFGRRKDGLASVSGVLEGRGWQCRHEF